MSGILRNLALDAWYKVLVYAGSIVFGIGLFKEVHVITNGQLMLFGAGFFFIGLGEWKNRKLVSQFKVTNVYTGPAAILNAEIRRPDSVGRLFDTVGAILVLIAVWQIVAPYVDPFIDKFISAERAVETQTKHSPKPAQ